MKQRIRAFSLVEVVLAIGIVSFALVAIFGLFSFTSKSNGEVVDRSEAIGISNATSGFLETTGFVTVYGWAVDPTKAPKIYAYALTANGGTRGDNGPGQIVIRADNDAKLAAEVNDRQGRLYRLYLSVSPNMPIGTVAHPTASTLPVIANYVEAALSVQIRATAVPVLAAASDNNVFPLGLSPVLTYDLVLSR